MVSSLEKVNMVSGREKGNMALMISRSDILDFRLQNIRKFLQEKGYVIGCCEFCNCTAEDTPDYHAFLPGKGKHGFDDFQVRIYVYLQ